MSETGTHAYTIGHASAVAPEALIAMGAGLDLRYAMILTPDAYQLARIEGGDMLVATGTQESKLTDLSRAYEIRAFGLQAELRWTREGRTGEAIALADGHVAALGDPDPTHGQALDILARRYRVWGKPVRKERDATPSVAADADLAAAAPPRGWTTLSAGRIGSLCVPLAIGGNDEVVLEAREYVTLGEGGNAVVLFERLVRFAPAGEKE